MLKIDILFLYALHTSIIIALQCAMCIDRSNSIKYILVLIATQQHHLIYTLN